MIDAFIISTLSHHINTCVQLHNSGICLVSTDFHLYANPALKNITPKPQQTFSYFLTSACYFPTDSFKRKVITLVFGFVCAGGALRLASQERATAVTQRLRRTEITTDLPALSETQVFSVGEITPHRSLQNSPSSPISVNSLLLISGWGRLPAFICQRSADHQELSFFS